MTWKQLKNLAKKLKIKDSAIISVQQNRPYCVSSEAVSIGKDGKGWIIQDSDERDEYQTTGFDRQ